MTYHWIVPMTAAILNAALGVVVLSHGPARRINQLFALLSLMLVLWNLNIWILYFANDGSTALYWSNLFRIGTLLAAPVAATLFVTFSGSAGLVPRCCLWLSYGLSLVLIVANTGGWLVRGLRDYAWGFYPVGGWLYALVPVAVAIGFLLSLKVLVDVVRHSSSPRKRQQAKLWIAGTVIAWPLAMTNLIASFGVPFYPLGNFANVAYAMFIAYGISRHRLMDVDVVVTKGIVLLLLTGLLIVPVFCITLLLEEVFFGVIDYDFSFLLLFLFLLVVLVAPRVRHTAEQRIERSLFREKHEYRRTLRLFTRNLVRILDRRTLLEEIGRTLKNALGLGAVAIFMERESDGAFVVEHVVGVGPATREFPSVDPFVEWLKRRGRAALREEAADGPTEPVAGVVQRFAENGWEVCVGLAVSGELLGFLCLGAKNSVDAFSAVDLDLLDTLAGEAAIALENARLYEELRRSRDVIQREGRLSAIGTLAAGIAHEIRNPLVSIQTFFQLAPGRLQDEEFMNGFLKLTEGEVRRICDLITELLNFAKSPSRSRGRVRIKEVVGSVATLLMPHARSHGVALTCGEVADVDVSGDADQLKQVLINITLNAIEATEVNGSVVMSTEIRESEGREMCGLSVEDSGCGIPAGRCEDIFNPFFTTKIKGTGLGLSIAHQIISEHGGVITVRSEEGAGSKFDIALPIVASNEDVVGIGMEFRGSALGPS